MHLKRHTSTQYRLPILCTNNNRGRRRSSAIFRSNKQRLTEIIGSLGKMDIQRIGSTDLMQTPHFASFTKRFVW